MQQQFFKTMDPAFSALKASLPPKSAKTGSKLNNKSVKYFQVDLTLDQAKNIQAKLPKGFFLLDPSGEELQRIRNDYKSVFMQKEISSSKAQIIRNKKEQKKNEARQRMGGQGIEKKSEMKQVVKHEQVEKEKGIKKQTKPKVSRKPSQKMPIQVANNQDENQPSQQGYNQQINSIKVLEPQKKKEKHAIKQTTKKEIVNKTSQSEQIEKEQSKQPTNSLIQNQKYLGNNQVYQPYSIPSLPNNMPRYDPGLSQAQIQGTLEESTLRYLFGLPYSGPIIEQNVPKLNEKQKNFCINIIQRLKAHRSSQAFRVPVDPLSQGVPDYYYVVYVPMDLKTIEKKIGRDKYRNISQFHADVNMIFLNSYKYNLRQTKYFQSTIQFEDYYQQLLKQASQKPEQYSKQYTFKNSKPKNDDQEDYNQNNTKKQRNKRPYPQSFKSNTGSNLSKSQIFEKGGKRRGQKLSKIRSNFDDQSGIFSNSIAMQTLNDFHVEPSYNDTDKFAIKKEDNESSLKMKKTESMKIQAQQFHQSITKIFKNFNQIEKQKQKQKQKLKQYRMEEQGDKKMVSEQQEKDQMVGQPKQEVVEKKVAKQKRGRNKGKQIETSIQNARFTKRSDDYNDDDYMIQNNMRYEADIIQSLGPIEQQDAEAMSNQYNLLMSNKTQKNDMGLDIFDFGLFDGNNDHMMNQPQSQGQDVLQAFKVEEKIVEEQRSVEKYTPQSVKKIERKPKKLGQSQHTHTEEKPTKQKHTHHEQKVKKEPKLPLPPPPPPANQTNIFAQSNLPPTIIQQTQQVPTFVSAPTRQVPKPPTQQSGSIIQPSYHLHEQSIIVNNINTHPQMYPPGFPSHLSMNINPGSIDLYTQNTQHPNSGATGGLTSMSTAAYPKTVGVTPPISILSNIKSKKSKSKVKNSDEDYRCESDDDYVVESHRGKKKGERKTKHKGHKQSSNSMQNNQGPRKRGRQVRRGNSEAGLISEVMMLGDETINRQGSSYYYPIVTRNKEHQQQFSQNAWKGGEVNNEQVERVEMEVLEYQGQKVGKHIDPFAEIFENSKEEQINQPQPIQPIQSAQPAQLPKENSGMQQAI